MRKSRTLNLGTGTFVLLGFAALFFLTTQTTSRGLSFREPAALRLDREVRQHRRSQGGRTGVDVGRRNGTRHENRLRFQGIQGGRHACAWMRATIKIPTDSDASIYTQGLLGGKFIGITAGGAETYLKDKDQIDFTQSAFVLENLIGQVLANFTKSSGDSPTADKSKTEAPAAAEPKPTEKTK